MPMVWCEISILRRSFCFYIFISYSAGGKGKGFLPIDIYIYIHSSTNIFSINNVNYPRYESAFNTSLNQ